MSALHPWLAAIEQEFMPRTKRRGNVIQMSPMQREVTFWGKAVLMPNGCLEWTGDLNVKGYGRFNVGGRRIAAHRIACEYRDGVPVPEKLEPDHSCKNTRCIHPDHLEVVTRQINLHRGDSPVGINFRKTHCIAGHPLLPRTDGQKQRLCKICQIKKQRERRWAQGIKPRNYSVPRNYAS